MKASITAIIILSLLTKAHAADNPCERYKSLLLWGVTDLYTEKYVIKGGMREILNEIEKYGYILGDLKEEISKSAGEGYTFLYQIDLDADGSKDFVVMTFGGTANCADTFFLKTHNESKKITLMQGIDSSNYENEGRLCANWGEEILLLKNTYVVVRSLTERLSSVTFELYKAGINEKSKGICKINMSID